MRVLLPVVVSVAISLQPQAVSTVSAQVTSSDLRMLDLIFRNRFVPFSEQDGQPELLTVQERVASLGDSDDNIERYKAMIEGMARMYLGVWNEDIELALSLIHI